MVCEVIHLSGLHICTDGGTSFLEGIFFFSHKKGFAKAEHIHDIIYLNTKNNLLAACPRQIVLV